MKEENVVTRIYPAVGGKYRWVNWYYRDGILLKTEFSTMVCNSEEEALADAEKMKNC